MRRDEATTTQDVSVTTPTASTVVASSTSYAGQPHAFNEEDEPNLMVDYNESKISTVTNG